MKRKLLTLAAISIGLTGCSSLSQKECQTGDWKGIGYRDGLQGKQPSEISEHQKACSDYRIKLDTEEYERGREAGLAKYCLPNNGYRLGKNGKPYSFVCPKALE